MSYIRVWRICRSKYATSAFDGEGTRRAGGRWTPVGVKAVYTASCLALATLESLVRLAVEDISKGFVAVSADIPEDIAIEEFETTQLPDNWWDTPVPECLAVKGREWLDNRRTAVLKVPSAITIPVEANFLLNPEHPDFQQIQINQPEPFSLDKRLQKQHG